MHNVASVTWQDPSVFTNLKPGNVKATLVITYQDGITTTKDISFAAYQDSVILKCVDANTGQAFNVNYGENIQAGFDELDWGYPPTNGEFHVANVYPYWGGVAASPDNFIPIQHGYGLLKITKGSIDGPAVSYQDIKFAEEPDTYYIQYARFKDIVVTRVDEKGNVLYRYTLPTTYALPAGLNPYYEWEGDQYTTRALDVPHYTLDTTQLPTNASGDLNGAPDQLQYGTGTTTNVTYVYHFDGTATGSDDNDEKITTPKVIAHNVSANVNLSGGRTNGSFDFTEAINGIIATAKQRDLVYLGNVGREAGHTPYTNRSIIVARAHYGKYFITVKIDGKESKTYSVNGVTGPSYDLTNVITQIKAMYSNYTFSGTQGDISGNQTIFDHTVVMNFVSDHTVPIQYVDDDNNGEVVGDGSSISGDTGQTVIPKYTIPDGYDYVSGRQDTYTFAATDNPAIIIHLRHQHKEVTENKTITETIHYVYPNGQTAQPDRVTTVTLSRKGDQDIVTETITWAAWSTGKFDTVVTPTITGYTPDLAAIDSIVVDVTTGDIIKTVTYTEDPVPTPQVPVKSIDELQDPPVTPFPSLSPVAEAKKPNVKVQHRVLAPITEKQRLPQTGDEQASLEFGIGIALIMSALGLSGIEKNRNKQE